MKLTGVFPTATPYLLAALTSTLLYPTAMLLNAFPPALLNAENSVSPQSSVNYNHKKKQRHKNESKLNKLMLNKM